jgi:hypothetical protein
MKRWGRLLLASALAVWLAAKLLTGDPPAFGYTAWAASVKDGDVIMLTGTSWRGSLVRLFGRHETDYSHTGIAEVEGGRVFLLHADPQRGCVRDDLEPMFARHVFLAATAYFSPTTDDAGQRRILKFAEDAVTTKAGFNGSFKFGAEPSRLYCSELVVRAYQQAGVALLKSIPDSGVIFPDALVRDGQMQPRP